MDAITTQQEAGDAALTAPTPEQFLAYVEAFLAESGIKPTRFGIDAMAEGGLVASLRNGRKLGLDNVNKVLAYIADWRATNPAVAANKADWPIEAGGKSKENTAPETKDIMDGGAEVPHAPFSPTSSETNGQSSSKQTDANPACSDGQSSTGSEEAAAA